MYLGLDIGTTATKAILIDARQTVVARAQMAYATTHPAPGLAEQNPDLWVEAVSTVVTALRQQNAAAVASVSAIGLSGQMHSLVALGADDRPLRPAILWNDARGKLECAGLMRDIPDLGAISGVVAMPSFTAAKLLWLRNHEPAVFDRLTHLLWPKDFVRLWMTGEYATDMSDAAGAQLLDQRARGWSDPILAAVGLSPEHLPRLLEGVEVSGRLRADVATLLGLPPGIPVAAGGGDAGTGAVGLGCVHDGASFISLGTGATFVVVQAAYRPKPEAILHDFAHCVPDRWFQMAAMLNGASALAWTAGLLGQASIEALLQTVEERYRGPSRVLFLPYLNGERTPHNDTDARGAFIGLDSSVDPVDMAQAVLEGVAFSLRDAMLALQAAGCAFDDPGFIGGGARSAFWGSLIATVLGRPLYRYEDADLGPALGAARLGLVAATGQAVAEVARLPDRRTAILPDLGLHHRYAERHVTYQALYPALKDLG